MSHLLRERTIFMCVRVCVLQCHMQFLLFIVVRTACCVVYVTPDDDCDPLPEQEGRSWGTTPDVLDTRSLNNALIRIHLHSQYSFMAILSILKVP